MKIKISFRTIVTILSFMGAIFLGLTRIADPEFVEVMRLKYFELIQVMSFFSVLRPHEKDSSFVCRHDSLYDVKAWA